MSRRISLPGADELFRKTTLSAVPDQVEETAEVVHTNRPTTATAKAAPKTNSVRQTPRRRPTGIDHGPSGREKHDKKLPFIYRQKNCSIWNKLVYICAVILA